MKYNEINSRCIYLYHAEQMTNLNIDMKYMAHIYTYRQANAYAQIVNVRVKGEIMSYSILAIYKTYASLRFSSVHFQPTRTNFFICACAPLLFSILSLL